MRIPDSPAPGDRPGNDPGRPVEPSDHGPVHAAFYRPFLVAVFLAALGVMAALLWPFRHAILMALILASLVHPLRRRLPGPVRSRRLLSSAVLSSGTVLFILLPVLVILVMLAGEAAAFTRQAVAWIKSGGLQDLEAWFRGLDLPAWASGFVDPATLDLHDIEARLLASGGEIGRRFFTAGRNVLETVLESAVQLLVTVLFLFYFLADGERLVAALRRASPLRRDQEDAIFARFNAVSRSVLFGGLGTSLVNGALTGLGLWLAGLNPLLWGAVAVVTSLIPMVGMSLIFVPSILYVAATGSLRNAGLLLAYWLVVIHSADNVVRPLLMHGKARLPMLWLFVSVIGGLVAFGPLGFLYGPIALAVCFVIFEIFLDSQEGTRIIVPPGP